MTPNDEIGHDAALMAQARLALRATIEEFHKQWRGPNHAQCPYCHASARVHNFGLAQRVPEDHPSRRMVRRVFT